jgi:hypothetical protein
MICNKCNNKEIQNACVGCGKFFCKDCSVEVNNKIYCKDCLNELFKNKEKQTNVFMNSSSASSSSSSSSSSGYVPPYPTQSVIIHIILFCFTLGIGNIFYCISIANKQHAWDLRYGRRL